MCRRRCENNNVFKWNRKLFSVCRLIKDSSKKKTNAALVNFNILNIQQIEQFPNCIDSFEMLFIIFSAVYARVLANECEFRML